MGTSKSRALLLLSLSETVGPPSLCARFERSVFVLFRCGDDLVVCDRVYYSLVVSLVVMRVLAVVLWRNVFDERRVELSAITVSSFPLFSCLFSCLFFEKRRKVSFPPYLYKNNSRC